MTPSAPTASRAESAKVLLRLPRQLHEQVKQVANDGGVSVNTLLVAVVASGIGFTLDPEGR